MGFPNKSFTVMRKKIEGDGKVEEDGIQPILKLYKILVVATLDGRRRNYASLLTRPLKWLLLL